MGKTVTITEMERGFCVEGYSGFPFTKANDRNAVFEHHDWRKELPHEAINFINNFLYPPQQEDDHAKENDASAEANAGDSGDGDRRGAEGV